MFDRFGEFGSAEEVTEQRTEEERRFRELFGRLRKKYHLWMHLHESIYERQDDQIEIWRREDGKKVETICRVKEKDIEDCYRKAVIDLEHFEKKMQEKEACGQVRQKAQDKILPRH